MAARVSGARAVSHPTEVVDVGASNAFDDLSVLLNPRLSAVGPDAEGDHPDPVTLSEPVYDDQGLLRWSSLPPQGP
jgi:hypothetical protein